MRYDQLNRNDHGSYTGKTDLSSNVNVMGENESKEIIVHKTLSKNKSKDVSKSARNIVHKTLSQNNSADESDNIITVLKDEEHEEPLVNEKLTSYFDISSVVEIY